MKHKTVFVAMSGGVDSSVAAGLLKKQGFDVVGVFMKNWSPIPSASGCSSQDDFESAAKAATALDIPLYVWNFEKEYKEQVFEYMLREYLAGRTPNPDAMCNKEIKCGVFFESALAAGADFVATGHYARVREIKNQSRHQRVGTPTEASEKPKIKNYALLAGIDKNKDQSYFLWALTQRHLARTLFPIGEYTKPQVRELALKFGLPNAERRDSQGLCFVGKVNFQEFLREYLPVKKGLVVTTSGVTLGEHDGAHYYTIGQRHGLGFAGGMPYYVTAKDIRNNTLVVAPGRDNPALFKQELEIQDLNWISGIEPQFPLSCQARIRYRQPLQSCQIEAQNIADLTQNYTESISATVSVPSVGVRVRFSEMQWAVAPGQSIVFYKGGEVLGGGIIM